ncbi:MAG: 50S ribosomal protein L21 [Myxococcota bacterium]
MLFSTRFEDRVHLVILALPILGANKAAASRPELVAYARDGRRYAVIESGGKQHRVTEGDLIKVEKIDGEVGASHTYDRVLMVGGDGETKIGQPTIQGAAVQAEIVRQGRDRKVLVFKMKRRKNYRRMYGHRQPFTHLRIKSIQLG